MRRVGATVWLGLMAACTTVPIPRPVPVVPSLPVAVESPTSAEAVERVRALAVERSDPQRGAPLHDVALDEVAKVAAASAAAGYVVSSDAVQVAIGEHLGSGLAPYLLTARGDDAAATAQLGPALVELRAQAGIASVGVAEARGATGRVIAVVAMPPPIQPVAIARDGTTARLAVPWPWPEPPRAFDVTELRARSLTPQLRDDAVELVIDCAHAAGRTIELDAGDRLVASVVNVCGPSPRPPPALTDIGPAARTQVEIEERLFELINRERVAAGRAPLVWDATAQKLARHHSARMQALRFIGHVAPDGQNLNDRVRQAYLPAVETFENVGYADGPGRAHLAFMASPGHRHNLLAERARRGAVGVTPSTRDPAWFYVTEVFFEPQP